MSDDETYPPLISPRSPSYERAWTEFLHPTARNSGPALAVLSELCDAEQNASEACLTLATLLSHSPFADVVRDRGALHDARRQGIGKLMERLGGSAPAPDNARVVLVQTMDSIASASSDKAAKQSLALLHKELSAAYEAAMQNESLDPQQRRALVGLAPAARFNR